MPPFGTAERGFDHDTAWWLANACQLVYSDEQQLAPHLARVGWTLEAFLSGPSTQAFVVSHDSYAIVAFRGAEMIALPDVWRVLDVRMVPWDSLGSGVVHHGFMAALDEVWESLMVVLDRVEARGLPVWYTGFSLGAGLAVLAAARRRPRAVYTFGAPRIGDKVFQQRMADVPIYRVVNEADIVPSLPMRRWGYRHVGQLIYLDEEKGLCAEPSRSQVLDWQSRAVARYQRTRPWLDPRRTTARRLADHGIINYVAGLTRIVKMRGTSDQPDSLQDRSCELS